jgi:hypothetical protein
LCLGIGPFRTASVTFEMLCQQKKPGKDSEISGRRTLSPWARWPTVDDAG